MNEKQCSKFLSLVLRHSPETIGIELDENGWVSVDQLLSCMSKNGNPISIEFLNQVVANNDKKRFAFSDDGLRIRASQGHSVDINLGLSPIEPPSILYHGTATRFLESILEHGLTSQSRTHVHLSKSIETAYSVGKRHGSPVVLLIDAHQMFLDGHQFFQSENGVFLTDHVDVKYISVGE